ncbi:MAG: hypothetical protein MJ241_04420 [Bacilli bacterium]|nr:hypothetical protein [Bacilli bacterium]
MKKKSLTLILASALFLASCGVATTSTSSDEKGDSAASQTSLDSLTSSEVSSTGASSNSSSEVNSESPSTLPSESSSVASEQSAEASSYVSSDSSVQSQETSSAESSHPSQESSSAESSHPSQESSSAESSHPSQESSSVESSHQSQESSESSKTPIEVKYTGAAHADMIAAPGKYVVFAGKDEASEYVSAYSVGNDVTIEIGSYAETLPSAAQLALRYHIAGIAKDDKYKASATIVTDTDIRLYFSKNVYFDYEAGKEGTLDVNFTYSSNTAFNAVLRNKGTGDNFSGTGTITFKDLVIEKI